MNMDSIKSEKEQDKNLKSIFVTDHLIDKETDFTQASKYSRSFPSLRGFLKYLKTHEIDIYPVTNETRKIPDSFNDALVSGFPFKATKGYLHYLNHALKIYSPVFLISESNLPCDLIKLPDEWDKEGDLTFTCFIRENELNSSGGNATLNLGNRKINCPKYEKLDESTRQEFASQGMPCENPKRYYKSDSDLVNAITVLYNEFERVRTTKLIPITRFSAFIDAMLWFYCIGEQIANKKVKENVKKAENRAAMFMEMFNPTLK
jgi:hypothetical protein